jgi:hypothetical protein
VHAASPQAPAAAPRPPTTQGPGGPGAGVQQVPPDQGKSEPEPLLLDSSPADNINFRPIMVGQVESALVRFKAGIPVGVASVLMPTPPKIIGGDDAFSVSATDCGDMRPGASCNMYVQFAPKAARSYVAILRWGNVSLPLSGTGEDGGKSPATPDPPPGTTPAVSANPPPPATPASTMPVPAPDLIDLDCGALQPQCVLVTRNGDTYTTANDGEVWSLASSNDPTKLPRRATVASFAEASGHTPLPNAVAMRSYGGDLARSWAVDTNGAIWRAMASPWVPVTRSAAATLPGHAPLTSGQTYGRFLPPWYLLVMLLCGLVIQFGGRPVPTRAADEPRGVATNRIPRTPILRWPATTAPRTSLSSPGNRTRWASAPSPPASRSSSATPTPGRRSSSPSTADGEAGRAR